MHEIQITHRFIEVSRTAESQGSFETVGKCQDCGVEQNTLHLTTTSEKRSNNCSLEEVASTASKRIRELLTQLLERHDKAIRELLTDNKYQTLEELDAEVAKRYGGKVCPGKMTYKQLDYWANTSTKRLQRKVLLAFKQGLVCNRCDSIVVSMDDLTVDHIWPDRSKGELTHLQLLCRSCHNAKGRRPPGEKDISPFMYEGEPCKHRITCVEINNLRSDV